MCLVQWYWTVSIVAGIFVVANFVGVLLYVRQARKQAEGTQRIANQAYDPLVTTRIVETHAVGANAIQVRLGLVIREDLLTDIRVLIINLSRAVSRFRFTACSWFVQGGPYYDPVEPLYRGEEDFYSAPGPPLEGHFFVDISAILSPVLNVDTITANTDLTPILNYFVQNTFHISTNVTYPNVEGREPEPTFEYYFIPSGTSPVFITVLGRGYIYIPGQWVHGQPH